MHPLVALQNVEVVHPVAVKIGVMLHPHGRQHAEQKRLDGLLRNRRRLEADVVKAVADGRAVDVASAM